jgi:hypothetical protein
MPVQLSPLLLSEVLFALICQLAFCFSEVNLSQGEVMVKDS